jgi:hypothetical protein
MAKSKKVNNGGGAAAAVAAAAAATHSPPCATGIVLPMTENEWSIGKVLGAGSQGAVYEIVIGADIIASSSGGGGKSSSSSAVVVAAVAGTGNVSTEWVVKVTPYVAPSNNKKTNKNNTDIAVLNANSLNKEGLLYQSHLPKLRGVYIPKNPPHPLLAFHANVNGTSCRTCRLFLFFIFSSFHHSKLSRTHTLFPSVFLLVYKYPYTGDRFHLLGDGTHGMFAARWHYFTATAGSGCCE